MKPLAILASLILACSAGPLRAQQDSAPVTMVDDLSSTIGGLKMAEEFIFAESQQQFYGLPTPDPYSQYGGLETLAVGGLFNGTERYLARSLKELPSLYFPNRLKVLNSRYDTSIHFIGVATMEEIETDSFKRQHRRFFDLPAGETADAITAPDGKCRIIRIRQGATIDRTLIIAFRGAKTYLTGRESSTVASCLNRGTFYHFGYSNVGIYGRKQFGVNRGFEGVGMDVNYAPPKVPGMFSGALVGLSRADFLAHIAKDAKTDQAVAGEESRKLLSADAYELEEASGRTYAGTPFGDTRITGHYKTVRYFDRWAFTKGQSKLITNTNDYTQVYYAGLLESQKALTDFNHDTLKQAGWGNGLLQAAIPQAADLLIVGVADVASSTPAHIEEALNWSLTSGKPKGIYTVPSWDIDTVTPDGMENSCRLYRSRVGNAVGATLAVVKVGKAVSDQAASPDALLQIVDCINRAHFYQIGFSNIGYQPVGQFASFVVPAGGTTAGGYGLPGDIPVTPPPFMLSGEKNWTMERPKALNEYFLSLHKPGEPIKHFRIGGTPRSDGL